MRSDGFSLFAEKTGTRKNGLYVKDKKGKESKIEGNYPDYKKAIPTEAVGSTKVNVSSLRDFLSSVKANNAKDFRDGKARVIIRTDYGDYLYNAKLLSQVADFMEKHGLDELQFEGRYGKMVAQNKSAIGLLMPIFFDGSGLEESEAFGYDIRTDKRGERFSLPERERERDDEYKRLADIVETSANPQEISSAKARMREILDEVKREKGYSDDSSYQGTSAFNGAAPSKNGYFETKEERKAAFEKGEFEGDASLGDFMDSGIDVTNLEFTLHDPRSYRSADAMRRESIDNLRSAVDSGSKTITMYRSVPASVTEGEFRNGDWVTPSRAYAELNAEIHGWGNDYRIIEQEVSVDDVWWDGNDIAEWGYDNGRDEVYKNTENNRKSDALITYDDNGNIILPSQRFNEGKSDIRFSLPNEREDKKPVFYSNAQRAVDGIRQEKAKAEQWLAMIQKQGGLKAAEDKWLGLSDWLNERKGKSLTKQEVLDYIRENDVQVEEVEYGEYNELEVPEFVKDYQEEYRNYYNEAVQDGKSEEKAEDYAWSKMLDNHGDDFALGFTPYGERLSFDSDSPYNTYLAEQFGERLPINSIRLGYTTQGLNNKREIALTVPTIEPYNESDTIHFGDAGEGRAVVWVRFGETKDADGNRVLVIDEIQSKRHQDGREKGYITDEDRKLKELTKKWADASRAANDNENALKKKYGDSSVTDDLLTDEEQDKRRLLWKKANDARAEMRSYSDAHPTASDNSRAVPNAPFDKNWHELAMKRVLRYAAENGYDKVAWTTGAQQAKRYDISKVVDSIELEYVGKNGRKMFGLKGFDFKIITDADGKIVKSMDELVGKNLSDVVGKDVANKMLEMQEGDVIEGNDLRIGGEGMKGFYDQILPRFMDKYGKKWDVKTHDVTLPNVEEAGRTMHAVDVTPEMRESVMQGQPKFSLPEDGTLTDKEIALRDALVEKIGRAIGSENVITDWAEGQRVLDADAERRAKIMGTKTRKRQETIGTAFEGKELSEQQRAVVDSFSGKKSKVSVTMKDKKGKARNITFRQGNDKTAGVKHSVFGHCNTDKNGYTPEEVGLIPDIVSNGEREQKGEKVSYKYTDNGVSYTVTTERRKSGEEFFTNFFTNRKPTAVVNGTSNTAKQHAPQQSVSGAKLQKVSDSSKEETDKIFDAAKRRFGTTYDLREAGYILPDGTMLDFSGRHELFGTDDTHIRGRRSTDHRNISSIAYEYDAEGNEVETGIETDMPDFIRRGAIRIDNNAGTINLSQAPTAAQKEVLRRLIGKNDGYVSVDFGDGWDSEHYAEYDEARPQRVLSDIDRYYSEGIKPTGNAAEIGQPKFFRTENGDAYGFTLNGKIYIDPRVATAETPVHEYHHLWAEALEKSNPDAWAHLKSELYKDADLVSWVKERYPDLAGDENDLAHELFAKFGGKRGAERLREEQAKAEAENKDGIIGKVRIIAMFNRFKDMLSKYWQMARDVFAGNNAKLKDKSADDFADMAMADLMKEVKPRDDAATQTQHTETRFSLPSETEDVSRGDQLFLFDDGMMESSGRRYSLTEEDRKVSSAHDAMSHRGLREIVGEDGYDAFLDDVGRRLREDVKREVSSSVGREFLDDVLGVATNAQHTGRGRSYEERRRDTVGLTIGLLLERIW